MRTIIKGILSAWVISMGWACKEEKKVLAYQMPQEDHVLDGITVNTPRTSGNLSLFVLTGKAAVEGKSYQTLSKAMEARTVTVKETGTVSELSIDNHSDAYVFIHSGDIVKGGKQDRTVSYDVIIPPHSKEVPLQSFCVEQGRWQQRGGEAVSAFGSNSKMLSSKDLKLAAKHEKDQGRVWSRVAEQKAHLNQKLSAKNGFVVNVADQESNSSLQLALENEVLGKNKDSIRATFQNLIDTPGAIGYAYVINGEIHGVEVYNNRLLFADLWDKLLESVIVEAISKEGDPVSAFKTEKDVIAYMKAVKVNDKKTDKKLNAITRFSTIEGEKGNLVFSTEDLEKKQWVHKSYMKADNDPVKKGGSRIRSHE